MRNYATSTDYLSAYSVWKRVLQKAQEVSLSSGWTETFLKVAEKYDEIEKLLWPSNSSGNGKPPTSSL
jgi:hypothetical protein